ncbi:MAG: response regulator [Candidatus Eisenbacteria bacterium]|nr:response regulator [Candidatus Eisenbacteria bacterium]MCC7143407.1 response regulator [Candidatus Eisenbacteria bacterium]
MTHDGGTSGRAIAHLSARELLQAMGELLFLLDEQTVVIDYLDGGGNDLALDPALFLGRSLAEFFPAETAAGLCAMLTEARQGGQPGSFEYQLAVNGQTREYEARGIVCADGTYLVGVRDTTAQREWARVQLTSANSALALQAEELALARNAALEAARRKSLFLGEVGQEIHDPLSAIRDLGESMLQDDLSPAHRNCMEAIVESSASVVRMMADLVEVIRFEAEARPLEREPFSPAETLRQAVERACAGAALPGERVVLNVDPKVPAYVLGDVETLAEVMVQLLRNSLRFAPTGPIELRLRGRGGARSQWLIRLEVEDRGTPIPAAERREIFTAFSPLVLKAHRTKGGAGLGLMLAALLVERLSGKLWVDGSPSGGNVFHCVLPFAVAEAEDLAQLPTPPPDELPRAPEQRVRILLADDSRVGRLLVQRMIEAWGYDCVAVEDGAQAVAAVRDRDFDLVLMDVQMPTMDGLQAAAEIRALPSARSRIPILALTGMDSKEDREQCEAAGMDGHVPKPIRAPELRAGIAELLATRRAA